MFFPHISSLTLLLPLLLSIVKTRSSVLEVDAINNDGIEKIYIKGYLGTPPQTMYYGWDIEKNYCFDIFTNSNTHYSVKNSITSVIYSHQIKYKDNQYAYNALDSFSFNQDTPWLQLNFYLIPFDIPFIFTFYLGFGRGQGSFMTQLLTNKIINNKVFEFKDTAFIIGGNYTNCSEYDMFPVTMLQNKSNTIYETYLDSVFINNHRIDNIKYKKAKFSTTLKGIRFPIEYYDLFYNVYFKNTKTCAPVDHGTIKKIECTKTKNNVFTANRLRWDMGEENNIITVEIDNNVMFNGLSSYNISNEFLVDFSRDCTEISIGYLWVQRWNMVFDWDKNIYVWRGRKRVGNGIRIRYLKKNEIVIKGLIVGDIIVGLFGIVMVLGMKIFK